MFAIICLCRYGNKCGIIGILTFNRILQCQGKEFKVWNNGWVFGMQLCSSLPDCKQKLLVSKLNYSGSTGIRTTFFVLCSA